MTASKANPSSMDAGDLIRGFEAKCDLSSAECAKLLDCQASKWSEWRSGTRKLSPYVRRSIVTHLLLSKKNLRQCGRDMGVKVK